MWQEPTANFMSHAAAHEADFLAVAQTVAQAYVNLQAMIVANGLMTRTICPMVATY